MSYTKEQFVEAAYEEIGLASYVYDLEPEQLQSAMRRMDAMMALWNSRGIRVGYPVPSSPENSDLDAETGVPDEANQAIICGLAVIIAPMHGKTVSPDTKTAADDGYRALLAKAAMPNEMQLPGSMPRGQGQKPWRYNQNEFISEPTDALAAGGDSKLEF